MREQNLCRRNVLVQNWLNTIETQTQEELECIWTKCQYLDWSKPINSPEEQELYHKVVDSQQDSWESVTQLSGEE